MIASVPGLCILFTFIAHLKDDFNNKMYCHYDYGNLKMIVLTYLWKGTDSVTNYSRNMSKLNVGLTNVLHYILSISHSKLILWF